MNKTHLKSPSNTPSEQEQKNMKEMDPHVSNFMDRTMRTLGAASMKQIRSSRMLIIGAGGLGIEVCKNLILTGVNTLILYDDKKVTWEDMSDNFALNEQDQGKSRIQAIKNKLKDLCPAFVNLILCDGNKEEFNIDELVEKVDVVIVTEELMGETQIKNNEKWRNKAKYISAEARGLAGRIFVDLQDEFEIKDVNAEEPTQNVITLITNEKQAIITTNDKARNHGLQEGDVVTFEGVTGMEHINGKEYTVVQNINKHQFQIDLDTENGPEYGGHGYVIQVKKPIKITFKPLKSVINEPTFMMYDFGKEKTPQVLHLAFQTLALFDKQFKRLPIPYDEQDAKRFKTIYDDLQNSSQKDKMKDEKTNESKIDYDKMEDEQMNETKNEDNEVKKEINRDEKLIEMFAKTAAGRLNPIVTFLGGLVAQEAMKGVTGKYTPIQQLFYFESYECISTNLPTKDKTRPQGTRYDGQIAVFGSDFQKKLGKQNVFLVGVGALGCEYLKNLALMGVSCGTGELVCTDLDSIELSNLSRQFLFRERHIGKMKSDSAAEMVKQMNPQLNIKAMQDRVAPETEVVFDEVFWETRDVMINALDNNSARRYVDEKCVTFCRPLIEAGTLGAKGNVQIIVPKLTENYGASQDPPEEGIHMCTMKHFPNMIAHTIAWAKDKFENDFKLEVDYVKDFLNDPELFFQRMGEQSVSIQIAVYESLVKNMYQFCCKTFSDCVKWAREKFQLYFHDTILELLYNFPHDLVTDSGVPFWSGDKRPPQPLKFDISDPLHYDFIHYAACLRATCYGIPIPSKKSDEIIRDALSTYTPKPFIPKKQHLDENSDEMQDVLPDDIEERCQSLMKQLISNQSTPSFPQLCSSEFEKDDDTNYHVDYMTAASNLRATNYSIKPASRLHTKGVAGKIIPAMITTTASITGLGMLEFYKLMQSLPTIEDSYKNSFMNLSVPSLYQSEPGLPESTLLRNQAFTIWDRYEVCAYRDIRLSDFLKFFLIKHKLTVEMIFWKNVMVYNALQSSSSKLLKKPMSKLVQDISQQSIPPQANFLFLEIGCVDSTTGEDVDTPIVHYQFRGFDPQKLAQLEARKRRLKS